MTEAYRLIDIYVFVYALCYWFQISMFQLDPSFERYAVFTCDTYIKQLCIFTSGNLLT